MTSFVWGGIILAVVLISSLDRIAAAEITLTATQNCDISLIGDIQPDDVKKLKLLLDREWGDVPVPAGRFATDQEIGRAITLCLDSEGNNFAEALKIIDAIFDYTSGSVKPIATVVEAKKKCLSACALIYLAGRWVGGDDAEGPLRYMHPRATVGLHAPYLPDVPTQNLGLLRRALQTGIEDVYKLLVLHEEYYPRSLLKEFLPKKPHEFFYLSTIADLGKWKIKLIDYRIPDVASRGQYIDLCDNAYSWKNVERFSRFSDSSFGASNRDRSDVEFSNPEEEKARRAEQLHLEQERRTRVGLPKGVTWMTVGSYGSEENERCTVQVYRGARDFVAVKIHGAWETPLPFPDHIKSRTADDTEREYGTPFWHFFPGRTKLAEVPVGKTEKRLSAPTIDPVPDEGEGNWMHNGSEVKFVISGNSWRIEYQKPRTGLEKVGVRLGTVLFQGVQSGQNITGKAFIFFQSCGRIPYDVTGTINNNRHLKLEGNAPTSCTGNTSPKVDKLEFVFQPDRRLY